MIVSAAVRVTPCAAACGWISNTFGLSVSWNSLKMAVRRATLTSPLMISLVMPFLFRNSLTRFSA